MMFKIISHTADIALEIVGETLEVLFAEAALGWKNIVLDNAPTVSKNRRRVKLISDEPEDLLVQWLSELNYFLTVHFWVYHNIESFSLKKTTDNWILEAEVSGEPLDSQRHFIQFDIKAVTYHQLEIRKISKNFATRVVFDI